MAQAKPSTGKGAVFTQGSTMRHVAVMTSTSAIGMISVFFVDAISLFYISQLNDAAQTAAVGRASYVLAFVIAISVGLMIGSSVLVARSIGAKKEQDARLYAGSSIILAFVLNTLAGLTLFVLSDTLLELLDAQDTALTYAQTYLHIVLIGTPFLGVGMVAMGILRAMGDAKRSMMITLIGGFLTALLDPIFIFVLGWEVVGAATVSMTIRIFFAALGMYFLMVTHDALAWGGVKRVISDAKDMGKIAVPAVITNLAAPVGAFLIAEKIADYGDAAIAGQAVVDRLVPLAFGVIFSLSGAVGPIIGQNFGAGLLPRVRQTFIDGLVFNALYVLVAWTILFFGRNAIIATYSATGDMALMIDLFCTVVAGSFLFNGTLFVTNATFNNLGRPFWASMFNWARQTIGVLPFIWVGAQMAELRGIAWGAAIGSIPFSIAAVIAAFWLINKHTQNANVSSATAAPAE